MNGVLLEDRPGDTLFVPRSGILLPGKGIMYPGITELEEIQDRHGKKVKPIGGGAFSASGMYVATFIDILDASQEAVDLSLTTHKWALYTNTLTPNFSTDTGYTATNEISGTNYTATGRTIAAGGGSPTVTESPATVVMYDQNDMTWPTATFTARGGILYADALTTPVADPLIVGQTYGADITATAGTFTIQFASGGVLTLDLY
jgi:hypothetical protein